MIQEFVPVNNEEYTNGLDALQAEYTQMLLLPIFQFHMGNPSLLYKLIHVNRNLYYLSISKIWIIKNNHVGLVKKNQKNKNRNTGLHPLYSRCVWVNVKHSKSTTYQ